MGVRRYFCQCMETKTKTFSTYEKKGPYPPPPPNRENDAQNKKQCLSLKEKPIHMEKKAPIRGGKSLKNAYQIENFLFSWGGGGATAYSCSSLFGNCSSCNYIKIHSKMHQIEIFL